LGPAEHPRATDRNGPGLGLVARPVDIRSARFRSPHSRLGGKTADPLAKRTHQRLVRDVVTSVRLQAAIKVFATEDRRSAALPWEVKFVRQHFYELPQQAAAPLVAM
jgi:hypothetical protein